MEFQEVGGRGHGLDLAGSGKRQFGAIVNAVMNRVP
jgi:hypothetical protein